MGQGYVRRFGFFCLLLATAATPRGSLAQAPAERAARALEAMQFPDGRFAGANGLDVLDTSEAVLALAAVSPGSAAIAKGRSALLLARPGSLDLEARRLGAICGDRGLAFGLSFAEDALAADGGLGDAPRAGVASVYATASFIEQLRRCNGDGLSRLSRAAKALQLLQRADGGFGLSGDDSMVEVTAIAVAALAPIAATTGTAPAVTTGAAFLRERQSRSGGFGSGSAADTALALLALSAASGQAGTAGLAAGVRYLTGLQALDGSFGGPRQTALAARALHASRNALVAEEVQRRAAAVRPAVGPVAHAEAAAAAAPPGSNEHPRGASERREHSKPDHRAGLPAASLPRWQLAFSPAAVTRLLGSARPVDVRPLLAAARFSNDNARLSGIAEFRERELSLQGVEVRLPAGRFYVERLVLEGGASLATEPGAEVELFVGGPIEVGKDSTLAAIPGDGSSLVVMTDAPEGQVVVDDSSLDGAVVVAPGAGVMLGWAGVPEGARWKAPPAPPDGLRTPDARQFSAGPVAP